MEQTFPCDRYGKPLHIKTPPTEFDKDLFLKELQDTERILKERGSVIKEPDFYPRWSCEKCPCDQVPFEYVHNGYKWKSYLRHLIRYHDYFPSPTFYTLILTEARSLRKVYEDGNPESVYGSVNPPKESPSEIDIDRLIDGLKKWQGIRSAPEGMERDKTFKCPHCDFVCEEPIRYKYENVRWHEYHTHLFEDHGHLPSKTLYEKMIEHGRTTEQRRIHAEREARLDAEYQKLLEAGELSD